MDPLDILSFNHCFAEISEGKKIHYVDERPRGVSSSTSTLLLVHGFPDFWYGWRYQIKPWVAKGYRIIAPDCTGYNGTYQPSGVENFTPKAVSQDLVGLLDALGIQKVIVVAHDWGAAITWRMCAWYPDRIDAVALASVPYSPPPLQYLSPEETANRVPDYGYMRYFADQGSTAEIHQRLLRFFKLVFSSPRSKDDQKAPEWAVGENLRKIIIGEIHVHPTGDLLSTEELEAYLRAFTPGKENKGLEGPLSYYRTGVLRFEQEKGLPASLPSDLPVLFLQPTLDASCPDHLVKRMSKYVPTLKVVQVDCGHWVMLERPDEITQTVSEWLDSLGCYSPHSKL